MQIPWNTFYSFVVSNNAESIVNYIDLPDTIEVWIDYHGKMWDAVLTKGSSDEIQFNTNIKPKIVTATPVIQTVDNIPIVTTAPYASGRQFLMRGNGGLNWIAQPNATSIFDMAVEASMVGADGLVLLFGGDYFTDENVGTDDYIEFSVVDKDDVLGLFATYGLSTANGDVLELSKYVSKHPVKVNDYKLIVPGQATSLVQGLYLRTTYVASAVGVARKLHINFWLAK